MACKLHRARGDHGTLPPAARLDVRSMATRNPARYHGPATRWSLAALGAALAQERLGTMSRSRLWRLLDDAARKPPRSVYGLHSHDPAWETKAPNICALYLNALRCFEQNRVVIGSDEKTGRQMLQRQYPTPPMAPGQ